MTVINPNSVAGINSITVQSGNSLSVHKSSGELIQTIVGATGVSTFSSVSVGSATTDNSASKSINIGLGASISQHTDNTLTFGTAGDPVAKFDASGQLLLGTGTARQKLHINASDSGAANMVFTNTTTGTSASDGFIVGISGAEDAQINMQESANLKFSTADTEALRIDSSQRLLVGNTSSRNVGGSTTFSKFQIEGTSAVTSSISLVDNEPTSSSAFLFFGKSRGNSIGESGIVQNGDTLGGLSFIGADGNDLNNRTAEITAEVNGSPANNTIPTDLVFSTSAQNATQLAERLRITSSGSVGIGTDTPGAVLEVFDTTSNTILNVKSGDAGAVLNLIDNNARSSIEQNGTDLKIISDTDAGDADSTIKLQVDGGTKMLIDSTGNVKVVSRGSSDSGAPFYVAVTGKSSIDYAGGSDDTANIRIKDEGSSNSYYHGIELRSKRDGDARIYAQDMGSDACDLVFATDNSGITEKLRITAAGRIGVNKSDPEAQVHVHKTNHYVLTNSGKAVHHIHTSGPNGNAGEYGGAISFAMGSTGAAAIAGLQGAADADNVGLAFITHNSGTGSADAVEMMRITSDGRIQANTQSQSDNEKYNFFFNGQADNQNCFTIRNDNSYDNVALIIKHGRGGLSGFSGKAVSFRGNDFTEEGSIVIGTTSVAYNTSSDYRLKENQVAISDGITRLKTLKPYRFNFKKDTGTTVDGFFAHEVTAVPEAVFGEKDAMKKIYYEEGDTLPSGKNVGDFKEFSSTEISPQSMDHSKLVPLLTAALQEAVTKIEILEAKVAALEGS